MDELRAALAEVAKIFGPAAEPAGRAQLPPREAEICDRLCSDWVLGLLAWAMEGGR